VGVSGVVGEALEEEGVFPLFVEGIKILGGGEGGREGGREGGCLPC